MSRVIPSGATDEVSFAFTTEPGEVSLVHWGTGFYAVELNVTTAGGNVSGYKAQLLRVNSTCGVPAIIATSASQTGTGIKTFTFSDVTSSGASTDRFQLRVLGSAGGGGGTSRTLTIQVNTADAEVMVPWLDDDGDGFANTGDNCPATPNPDQRNVDPPDGVGDACDPDDFDGDTFSDRVEYAVTTDPGLRCGTNAHPADFNSDTFIDITDIGDVAASFGKTVPLLAPIRLNIAPDPVDGSVDITDIGRVAGLFGRTCLSTPTPTPGP